MAKSRREPGVARLTVFNPFDPGFRLDPYPHYEALRAAEPVHRSDLLQGWVLTRYDDCVRALRDLETFSSDARQATSRLAQMRVAQRADLQMDADTVLTTDPPIHTRLRALVNKAFTPTRVERLRGHIQEVAESLLDGAAEPERFDVIQGLAQPLPIIVIAEMLGVPPGDRDTFKRWSTSIAALTNPVVSPQILETVRQERDELGQYLWRFIEERHAHPQDDLITALVQAEEAGAGLTVKELLGFIVLLLVAGNETTTNLIGNGTMALIQHPDQAALLRQEPALLPAAVEEMVRYDSPVQGSVRFALRDVEIGGRAITQGDSIFVMIGAANRDPAIFPDPGRFDIRRTDNRHLSFGQGIHYCLGGGLARLEAQVTLGALLRRFPELALADEAPAYGGTFVLRGLSRLPLRRPAVRVVD